MSDELVVYGGGRYVVATDELLAHAECLARLVNTVGDVRGKLAAIDGRIQRSTLVSLDASFSAFRAEEDMRLASAALGHCEADARALVFALRGSMEVYGHAEAFNEHVAQELSARLGHTLGFLSPILVLLALPVLTASTAGILVGMLAPGRDVEGWIRQHNAILTNATTVSMLRHMVMSADDFAGGAQGLPAEVVHALGDEGIGLLGLNTSAALIVLMANRAGGLVETGVKVTRTDQRPGSVAESFADRASRIPRPGEEPEGEQIRVDRYSEPGKPDRFEVYVAGTVDFALATHEPWDSTSNLNALAGLPAGSYTAVEEAMAAAGVTADTPVVLTGYSQGGLMASMLAASGDYDVRGVVTFGGPVGQVDIPSDIPVLHVRHADDLVPAVGGHDVNQHALVVERNVYGGRDVPTELPVPAHQFANYQQTAELVDHAQSDQVRTRLADLAGFTAGATSVETTLFRADRVESCPTFPGPGR